MNTLKILEELKAEVVNYCDPSKKTVSMINRYIEIVEHFEGVKSPVAAKATIDAINEVEDNE